MTHSVGAPLHPNIIIELNKETGGGRKFVLVNYEMVSPKTETIQSSELSLILYLTLCCRYRELPLSGKH